MIFSNYQMKALHCQYLTPYMRYPTSYITIDNQSNNNIFLVHKTVTFYTVLYSRIHVHTFFKFARKSVVRKYNYRSGRFKNIITD